jgi:hypothetical protein
MKKVFLYLSIAIASGILFVNIYTSIVDARSWGSDIPNSIAAARAYFSSTNPGDFFRIFSPINQIMAMVALILFWKSGEVRKYLIAALVLYVIAEGFTFAYFYPRNELLFGKTDLADVSTLTRTWTEWSNMNWLRSLIILSGLTSSFIALHKTENRS